MRRLFDHSFFLWGCGLILLLAAVFMATATAAGRWLDGLVGVTISAIAGTAIAVRGRFPILLGFLIALAALANAAGYVFSLWHEDTVFDEAVHGFTSFAGMAGIGWAIGRHRRVWSDALLFAAIIALGIAFGLLWEGFEWLVDMIGSRRDTLIDLAADTIGAVLAGLLIASIHPGQSAKEPAAS